MAIFNGVTLPDLPNYDKNKYPYVFITYESSDTQFVSYLLLESEPIFYNPSTAQFEYVYPRVGALYQYPNSVGEEWLLLGEGTEDEPQEGAETGVSITDILWANFDILNKETGEVVMKSYDGVLLPPLPSDIDRTVYPYAYVARAYMSEYDYTTYMFMVADTPMEQNSNDYYILAGTKGVIGSINTTFDAWENVAEMGEVTTDTLLTDALQADGITLTVIWSEIAEEKLYSIKESTLKNIGNSIRGKTGKTELIPPEDMPSEIDGISSGGAELNIHYGDTEPSDTSMLWVKCDKPSGVLVDEITFGNLVLQANIAVLPRDISQNGVGVVGSKIYSFGGYAHNEIYVFDTTTKIIEKLNVTLPSNLYRMGVGVVGTKIYLFGGYDGSSAINKIFEFDTETNTLTTLSTTLSSARYDMGVGVYGTKIYLFGGYNGSELNTINVFDTTTNTISTLSTKLTEGNYAMGVGVVGNAIYLFGGTETSNGISQRIYRFYPSSNSLSKLSVSLPYRLRYMGVGVIDNEIYVMGGNPDGSNEDQNTIYLYDTTTSTLTTLSDTLPNKMYRIGVGVVGKNIFTIGGIGDKQAIHKLSKDFELESGKVQIRPSLTQNLFNILNGDITVKMGVIDAYLGNSENVGEQVEAYIYKDGAWTQI